MDSKAASRKANLKQYRPVDGKWQFVPVVRVKGKPGPELVLIDDKPASSKGGTFYLEWREDGKRKTRPLGTSPREALNAWQLQSSILSGTVEYADDLLEEPSSKTATTIDAAIKRYLHEVRATKSEATLRAYSKDLRWFRDHCTKHNVSTLSRNDAIALFAAEHEEKLDPKTVNKRVIVMLGAMRGAGAAISMKRGDWPKTIEKQAEIYGPEELKRFFAVCDPSERLLFQVFLCTGFRSREVSTLS